MLGPIPNPERGPKRVPNRTTHDAPRNAAANGRKIVV